MRGILAVTLIVLITISGCIGPPVSPLASIPKLLMDYVDGVTKIYVRGEDYRYSNITIQINQTIVAAENNTYSLKYETPLTNFDLNITVFDSGKIYEYICSVTVRLGEEKIFLIEEKGKDQKERSSPFTTMFWRKE